MNQYTRALILCLFSFSLAHYSQVTLPKGSIILWYGRENGVPEGWAVCDGKHGTPDLRDRFVIGSGLNAHHPPNSIGGHASVTPTITVQNHVLTLAEMPNHDHGGATDIEDSSEIYYDHPAPSNKYVSETECCRWYNIRRFSPNNFTELRHTHRIASAGQNQPHSHRATSSEIIINPPFYALLYIMKL